MVPPCCDGLLPRTVSLNKPLSPKLLLVGLCYHSSSEEVKPLDAGAIQAQLL